VFEEENYRATEPFPRIGFQTTNERRSPDDLPCCEVKQRNPIHTSIVAERQKSKCQSSGRNTCSAKLACDAPFATRCPAIPDRRLAEFPMNVARFGNPDYRR
jgi:hypothetical protein